MNEREEFEKWYDQQPDGRINPFDVWQARAALAAPQAEPVAWIRFRSDGGIEGPIMHYSIDDVRKRSGAWTPLYAAPPAPDAQEVLRLATELNRRFRSMNSVPIDKAMVPTSEWRALAALLGVAP